MSKSIYEFCEILGVSPGATPKEVKRAYQELVLVWHPDRFEGKERLLRRAEEQMKLINEAYEVLRNGVPAAGASEERYDVYDHDEAETNWDDHSPEYEEHIPYLSLLTFIPCLIILPKFLGSYERIEVSPRRLFIPAKYETVWETSWFWVVVFSLAITLATFLSAMERDFDAFVKWAAWIVLAYFVTKIVYL